MDRERSLGLWIIPEIRDVAAEFTWEPLVARMPSMQTRNRGYAHSCVTPVANGMKAKIQGKTAFYAWHD